MSKPGWSALALLSLAACGGGEGDRPATPNVLLITLDTTRFNALGCYGNPQNPTPNIDRIASEGLSYRRARTVTPLTLPAHASMLTGLYPNRHTVFANGLSALPQSANTLAELARANGVQTAAFVAAVVLDPTFGLAQGFETYDGPPRESRGGNSAWPELRAPQIVERATTWFEQRDRKRPFLAWLHFFDPHTPYAPPKELAEAMRGDYLGEVAFVDRSLGPLFERLRADGTLDQTLVIIVGDHGESLRFHGELTHGWYCYEATLRVPLIVRYPDGYRKGAAPTDVVSVVDVYPTALAALGIPAPGDIDGISLYRASAPAERGVYFELFNGWLSFGWSPFVGWFDSAGKYIHSSTPEFYDIGGDKQEADNLFASKGAEVERALRAIRAVRARPALAQDAPLEADPDLRAALRTLGCLGVDAAAGPLPDPLASDALPSPKERRDELVAFDEALLASDDGRLEDAVKLLKDLTGRYPANVLGRVYLASGLIQLQRFDEARALLEALVAQGQARANDFNSLGVCRERTGDLAGALAAFQRALELDPGQAWARQNVERLSKR